jgi:hypothetical protein
MAKTRLSPKATFVERGYGQVEPNHLSAQRNGQIYAQLPVEANIALLENGQFVKYNYKDGVVDFSGDGEWMLVFNEIKVYREGQSEQDFAMIRDNYVARVYSPIDGDANAPRQQLTQPRYYGGIDANGNAIPKVVTPADPYEVDSTDNPFAALWDYKGPKMMPQGTVMTPRVFKTMIGDIFTTNCIEIAGVADGDVAAYPAIGSSLFVGDDGYLTPTKGTNSGDMEWQVVKQYDLGDRQRAVKIMRIK